MRSSFTDVLIISPTKQGLGCHKAFWCCRNVQNSKSGTSKFSWCTGKLQFLAGGRFLPTWNGRRQATRKFLWIHSPYKQHPLLTYIQTNEKRTRPYFRRIWWIPHMKRHISFFQHWFCAQWCIKSLEHFQSKLSSTNLKQFCKTEESRMNFNGGGALNFLMCLLGSMLQEATRLPSSTSSFMKLSPDTQKFY